MKLPLPIQAARRDLEVRCGLLLRHRLQRAEVADVRGLAADARRSPVEQVPSCERGGE